MKRTTFRIGSWAAFAIALSVVPAHADPQITSWITGISSKYARIYTSTANRTNGVSATTWTNGTQVQSSPAYAGINEINSSTSWVYVRSTGLGGHVMGPWNNPNLPKNQQVLWRFPRTPQVPTTNRTASSASPTTATGLGSMGVFVDGVAAYNTSDGFSYSFSHSTDASPAGGIGNGDGIWNRDAFVNEANSFDNTLAHSQQGGEYHYHVNPIATRYLAGDNVLYNSSAKTYSENTSATIFTHSPIVGWMKDGLPIYGPYGYDGGGTGGTASATLNGTSISLITVNNSGSYFATPAVSFTGGGGSGAAAAATMKVLSAVVATAANSSAGGTGYKVGDTLTVIGGSGTVTATLTVASISGAGSTGPIATLTVAQVGSYSVVPPNYVSVSGGNGSGAVPTLTWGLAAINVTNGGTGYTSAPAVTIGGVRRMISGYQLRDGTNGTANLSAINSGVSTTTGRTSLPSWALTVQNRSQLSTASQYGPAVTTYSLGHYAEDYDYLGDLGYTQSSLANSGGVFFDLDVHNTRFCITPEFPNGTWAYFTTIKADGTSFYPYSVGRWYRGNPNSGGGSTTSTVMNADTPLTQQFLGGANTALTIGTPSVTSGTVTLTWNSVEGGTYSVDASQNGTTFTSEKTGLSPTNVPTAPTTGNQSVTTTTSYTTLGSTGTEYARVTRTALASYDSAGQTAATVSQISTATYLAGLATNAALSSLIPSAGSLSPSFSSGTTSYTAFVPNSTSSITLTPTVADSSATVQVNGVNVSSGTVSSAINLAVGANSINTKVTAQAGNTNTYTIVVTRQTTLQTWQQSWYGSTSTSTGNSAYLADPYSTGISNLLVFAYFGSSQNPASARSNLLPQPQLSGGNLFFNFTEPSGVSGITYGAQWSTTLLSNSWTSVSDTGSGTQHVFSVPVNGNTRLFLRLTATAP